MKDISINDFFTDTNLAGNTFGADSFAPIRSLNSAARGLPCSSSRELTLFQACTGRTEWPSAPSSRVFFIAGRRSAKSLNVAGNAVYDATCVDYVDHLAPGEIVTIPVICPDRKQSRNVTQYIRGILDGSTLLSGLVSKVSADTIDFECCRTRIEVHTSTFRSVRGYTCGSAYIDEGAFLPDDDASANPDIELVRSLIPAMSTVPNARLWFSSTPYRRTGVLHRAFQEHYGKDHSSVLVWRAATSVMNSTILASVIDEALVDDPAAARSEWLAEFRDDIDSFVGQEVIASCVVEGRTELQAMPHLRYSAFLDPAGGSGSDSFTLAIGHLASDMIIIDCIRENRPPFDPNAVCREFAGVLREYGISAVVGDKYAGSWPSERLGAYGVRYDSTAKPKTDLYRDLLPRLQFCGHRAAGSRPPPGPARRARTQASLWRTRHNRPRTSSRRARRCYKRGRRIELRTFAVEKGASDRAHRSRQAERISMAHYWQLFVRTRSSMGSSRGLGFFRCVTP